MKLTYYRIYFNKRLFLITFFLPTLSFSLQVSTDYACCWAPAPALRGLEINGDGDS